MSAFVQQLLGFGATAPSAFRNAELDSGPLRAAKISDGSTSLRTSGPPRSLEAPRSFYQDGLQSLLLDADVLFPARVWFSSSDPLAYVRAAMLQFPHIADAIKTQTEGVIGRPPDLQGSLIEQLKFTPFLNAGDAFLASILSILQEKSRKLAARIDRGDVSAGTYDKIIIGLGPHGTRAAQVFKDENVLGIDSSSRLGRNFGETGAFFNINSANRADTDEGAQTILGKGRGNINPLGGPVRIPDVTGQRYPTGQTIANVTLCNLYASGIPVLAGHQVVDIRRTKDIPGAKGARYTVRLLDREGNERIVTSDKVVLAPGLGAPKYTIDDSDNLIGDAIADFDALSFLDDDEAIRQYKSFDPGIRTVEAAFTLAKFQKDPLAPWREPFAVIGFGDSGKVFLEFTYGIGPKEVYDNPSSISRAQSGDVAASKWFVGENGPPDCRTFSLGDPANNRKPVRNRYSQIAGPATNRVEFINGRVTGIRKDTNGEGYIVQYTGGDQGAGQVYVRRVVLATGFESTAGRLVASLLDSPLSGPLETSDFVQRLLGEVRGTERSVALQLKGENVFQLGPPNALVENFVEPSERAGVNCNVVSLANVMERTAEAAAKINALAVAVPKTADVPVDGGAPLLLGKQESYRSPIVPANREAVQVDASTEVQVLATIDRILGARPVNGSGGKVYIDFIGASSASRVMLQTRGFSKLTHDNIVDEVSSREDFQRYLLACVRPGHTITFKYQVVGSYLDVGNPRRKND